MRYRRSRLAHLTAQGIEFPLAEYRGFTLSVDARKGAKSILYVSGTITHDLEFAGIAAGSLLNRIDAMINHMPIEAAREREKAKLKASQLESFQGRIGLQFESETRLKRLQEIRAELEGSLSATENRDRVAELVAEFDGIKESRDKPVPQPVFEVVEEAAPVLPPVALKHEAEIIRPLVDGWQRGKLFETPARVAPKKVAMAVKRTVGRPVQLSLF